MISQKQREIKKIASEGRLVHGSPNFDNENDVLQASVNVLTGDREAIDGQNVELMQAVVHEMAAEIPPTPQGPMKSIFWREPYGGGGLNLILPVLRRIIPSLKCEGKGKEHGA
ncbi:unnamed protein product [Linum trigynum]|uniref:Uncharacterized protein n=1 Tax=Linum trigynum TaxID=586398 RepID=A0AAV2G2D5_9ROSI